MMSQAHGVAIVKISQASRPVSLSVTDGAFLP